MYSTHKPQRVGFFFFKKQRCEVFVREGFSIPHFYVMPEGWAWNFALRMDKPIYWYTTMLTSNNVTYMDSSMEKSLMDFFKGKDGDGISYWQKAIRAWNSVNPEHKVKESLKMPDYSKAPFSIDVYNHWKERITEINAQRNKAYEDTIQHYDYVCLNCMGGGQESFSAISQYADMGYRVVTAVQGRDCGLPLIIMERLAPKEPINVDEIPEEEFMMSEKKEK